MSARSRSVVLWLCVSAGIPTSALANMARHQRVKVAALKEHGQTIGAKITVVLYPAGDYTSYTIGFVKDGIRSPRLDHVLGHGSTTGPVEKTFALRYGQGNRYRAGDRVFLESMWPRSVAEQARLKAALAGSNVNYLPGHHLWGENDSIVLPR
jgi:hypothetical protein